ncbi:hypothetical protein DAETH_10560 [Deinococcus aetherius]|uniref:Uncharacterized protein n=2 Tax=Deinococcus aetherius TaxID=200252 RepID=A0ABN6RCI6_9DEIO|nr:hypothetical protein DAETH_10560 [Deinococcus aetherius]
MTPSVDNAGITVTVNQVVNAQTGALKRLETEYEIKQPSLRLVVAPSSLGVTLDGYQLTVKDSAGTRFGGSEGQAQRGVSTHVMSGYACQTSSADATLITSTDQCAGTLKTPYPRNVDLGSLVLLNDSVASAVVEEYVASSGTNCPTLKLNVTLTGRDDLNRSITPLQVQNAPLAVTCNLTTSEE